MQLTCAFNEKCFEIPENDIEGKNCYQRYKCPSCGYFHTKFGDNKFQEISKRCIEKCINSWQTPFLYFFTDHSHYHSARLLRIFDKLASPADIKQEEMLMVLISAYLHDIGMQLIGKELKDKFEVLSGSTASISQDNELLDEVRKTHSTRIEDIIDSFFLESMKSSMLSDELKRLFRQLQEPVKTICRYHSCSMEELEKILDIKNSFPVGPSHRIPKERIIMLSALFRLSDELDLTRNRIGNFVKENFPFPKESILHWHKHHIISDVVINEKQEIRIEFDPKSGFSHDLIEIVNRKINNEIELINSLNLLRDGSNGKINLKLVSENLYNSNKKYWPDYIPKKERSILKEQLDLEKLKLDGEFSVLAQALSRERQYSDSEGGFTPVEKQSSDLLKVEEFNVFVQDLAKEWSYYDSEGGFAPVEKQSSNLLKDDEIRDLTDSVSAQKKRDTIIELTNRKLSENSTFPVAMSFGKCPVCNYASNDRKFFKAGSLCPKCNQEGIREIFPDYSAIESLRMIAHYYSVACGRIDDLQEKLTTDIQQVIGQTIDSEKAVKIAIESQDIYNVHSNESDCDERISQYIREQFSLNSREEAARIFFLLFSYSDTFEEHNSVVITACILLEILINELLVDMLINKDIHWSNAREQVENMGSFKKKSKLFKEITGLPLKDAMENYISGFYDNWDKLRDQRNDFIHGKPLSINRGTAETAFNLAKNSFSLFARLNNQFCIRSV